MDKMKVLIVIPAYYEQENIMMTIKDIQKIFPEADYYCCKWLLYRFYSRYLYKHQASFLNLSVNLGMVEVCRQDIVMRSTVNMISWSNLMETVSVMSDT